MTDRVEKALEKARQQRSGAASQPARGGPSRRVDASPAPMPLVYETTRQENVSLGTFKKNRIIAGLKDDWRADAFRVLRARVLQRMASEGWTTLGITSPAAGDGKTLTAVNLAICIAQDMNQTVLLVDADFRRPRIHTYFGLSPGVGLSDYLVGDCGLEDCFINPGIERLVILPQAASLLNSSEILAMPKTKGLFRELKARYPDRFVLYDLPPVLSSDDTIVILPNLDASLLVVQEGKSHENEVERALDLMRDHNLLGSVLNRSEHGEGYYY